MALDVYNTITVELSDKVFGVVTSGEGEGTLSRGTDNLIYRAASKVYEELGRGVPELLLSCQNDIPLARGLGSSAAAVVSGVTAANFLSGQTLSEDRLLQLCVELEGHPDNVAAALFGGCRVVVRDGKRLVQDRIPLPPNLKAVLFIPDFEMPTRKSRSILPRRVSREDVVHNLGRVALLVSALITDNPRYLRIATQDVLHQPQRQALFPAMDDFFEAALSAGAMGVFLSGGGPAVLALTEGDGRGIGKAMSEVAKREGIGGRVRLAQPSLEGASITST
jgi:homoserine kinase